MGGKFGKGRKGSSADLQLTSMVDMFTLLVIFLLANFSASGEVIFMSKEIQLPTASQDPAPALDRAATGSPRGSRSEPAPSRG